MLLVSVAVLIFSIMIHEIAHGLAALWQGDWTAQQAGRLTLNPVKHMDPWGSFIIPIFLIISGVGVVFGWAKPVPYNPYNLRDQKYGPAIVGAAGPFSNFLIVVFSGAMIRLFNLVGVSDVNFIYALLAIFIVVNISLMIFNLLPIPPLDGSKLLFTFLPISEHTKQLMEQYGFVFLLLFIYLFSGIFHDLVWSLSSSVAGISLAGFF